MTITDIRPFLAVGVSLLAAFPDYVQREKAECKRILERGCCVYQSCPDFFHGAGSIGWQCI